MMIIIILKFLLLFQLISYKFVSGYKWFAQYSYDDKTNCNAATLEKIVLFQAQKCTQVNTKGVISSYSTDCKIVGNTILRTLSNWTNGYCEGNYAYTGPYANNNSYASNKCMSGIGTKYVCVTDPDFENWAGEAKYNKNQYSSCSPYYGPDIIYAYPPTCIKAANGTTSKKYVNGTSSLSFYSYSPSAYCNGTIQQQKSYKFDVCSSATYDEYYSYPLTILPGVAFLARGNDILGSKVINKVFIGGIFSVVLIGVFLIMLGLTILFYYRRIYRPLKKLIIELANNDETSRDSQQALENVGVGSFCSWLFCSCGRIKNEEIKKLAE